MAGGGAEYEISPSCSDMEMLRIRVDSFIADRATASVLGLRRMGREGLLAYVAGRQTELGRTVSVYPDISGDADCCIFPDWRSGIEDMESLRRKAPGADIIYGQDLCHQVPAAVRYSGITAEDTNHTIGMKECSMESE